MRLSAHDREMVDEVAAFCATDASRPLLCSVHFDRGRVFATDSYRLDVRDADENGTLVVNPFTYERVVDRPLRIDGILNEAGTRRLSCLDGLKAKDVPRRQGAFCTCCQRLYPMPQWTPPGIDCRCNAPVVQSVFLRGALLAMDDPATRWAWTGNVLKPITYREDDHLHLLMPIRKVWS